MAKLDKFDLEAMKEGKAIRQMRGMVGVAKMNRRRPAKTEVANRYNKDRRALYA
jgi:hypothetical protein